MPGQPNQDPEFKAKLTEAIKFFSESIKAKEELKKKPRLGGPLFPESENEPIDSAKPSREKVKEALAWAERLSPPSKKRTRGQKGGTNNLAKGDREAEIGKLRRRLHDATMKRSKLRGDMVRVAQSITKFQSTLLDMQQQDALAAADAAAAEQALSRLESGLESGEGGEGEGEDKEDDGVVEGDSLFVSEDSEGEDA